jgi:cobalt/nickel transport protein
MKSNKITVIILISLTLLIIFVPLFLIKGAQFEGSDGAGSDMVEEIAENYEPWFTPVLETLIGGELPGEMETLFFCIQTGIGVGIIAYCFGYLVSRKKYSGEKTEKI